MLFGLDLSSALYFRYVLCAAHFAQSLLRKSEMKSTLYTSLNYLNTSIFLYIFDKQRHVYRCGCLNSPILKSACMRLTARLVDLTDQ